MTQTAGTDAYYLYSVLPAGAAAPPPAALLPGPPVTAVPIGALTVLASRVSRAAFDADDPANRTADPAWLAAWLAAHHAVNEAATAAGPCLPLAFGALFSSLDLVRAWLAPREHALLAALARVGGETEWALAMQEDAAAHAAWLDQHDPTLQRLARAAAAAGAGTAFLLARQREKALAAARAAAIDVAAEQILERLADASCRLIAEPPQAGLPRWTLLEPGGANPPERLRDRLERLAADLAPTGLLLRLTGPWPAYTAARAATAEEPTHG